MQRAAALCFGLIGLIGLVLGAGGLWVLFVPSSVEGMIWATPEALVRLCLIALAVGVAFLVAAGRLWPRLDGPA